MKQIITLLAVMVSVAVNAADPGGVPGFVKAVFTGSACDTTSDVFANAKMRVIVPGEMYASSLGPESVKVAPTLARWGSHRGLIWSCRPGGDFARAGFRLPERILTAA